MSLAQPHHPSEEWQDEQREAAMARQQMDAEAEAAIEHEGRMADRPTPRLPP